MIALELGCTWFMCGVIWIVQLLVYPAFAEIPAHRFKAFHAHHTQVITYVVAPAMGLEFIGAGVLAFAYRDVFWISNLFGVLALWALTGLIAVPLHEALPKAESPGPLIRRLVNTNWLRTALWSVRAGALWLYVNASP